MDVKPRPDCGQKNTIGQNRPKTSPGQFRNDAQPMRRSADDLGDPDLDVVLAMAGLAAGMLAAAPMIMIRLWALCLGIEDVGYDLGAGNQRQARPGRCLHCSAVAHG